jgi:ubiquinone/menaquinone biosynthesis C-methylase UbiE
MSGSPVAFSGSVPQYYDGYMRESLFEPFALELARRVPADARRILEIAAGTGIVTRRVHEAVPGAEIVATDLNEAMVDFARGAVAGDITWQAADAQDLPFEDGSFDVAICAFGFMFLPDKVKGFVEARRVLAPGGLLLGTTWHAVEEMPSITALAGTLARLFPDDTPTFLETPYGYGDHGRIRGDMEAAGWTDVELEDVTHTTEMPSATDAAIGWSRGTPLTGQLVERGADIDAVVEAVAGDFAAVGGQRPFRTEHTATIITARR